MTEITALSCGVCGRAVPVGGRYCPSCAAPLAGGDLLSVRTPPSAAKYRGPVHRRGTTSGWVKALVITLVVAVVAAVTVAILLAVGVGRVSRQVTSALTPQPGRPTGYHGPSYPGMLTQDKVSGGAGSKLEARGAVLTAGNLVAIPSFLGPTLCSPVTITDNSAAAVNIGPGDWKLQQPNGIIVAFTITGTLQFGQVVPGATAAGTVCFADTGKPRGTYLLLWQPLLQVGRGVWLLTL